MSTATITVTTGIQSPPRSLSGKEGNGELHFKIVTLLDKIDEMPGILSESEATRLNEIHQLENAIVNEELSDDQLDHIHDDLTRISQSPRLGLFKTLTSIAKSCDEVGEAAIERLKGASRIVRHMQHQPKTDSYQYAIERQFTIYMGIAKECFTATDSTMPDLDEAEFITRERSASVLTLVPEKEPPQVTIVVTPPDSAPLTEARKHEITREIPVKIAQIDALGSILSADHTRALAYIRDSLSFIKGHLDKYSIEELESMVSTLDAIIDAPEHKEHCRLINQLREVNPLLADQLEECARRIAELQRMENRSPQHRHLIERGLRRLQEEYNSIVAHLDASEETLEALLEEPESPEPAPGHRNFLERLNESIHDLLIKIIIFSVYLGQKILDYFD